MSNQRNFLAGVASSGWTALAGLLAIPWYIRFLGMDAYGLIGVHLTLQSVFMLLDLGLSPAVSREIARGEIAGTMPRARALVHSMSVLFVITGGVATVAMAASAPWLANHWLSSNALPVDQVGLALALSAFATGLRWPATLYAAVLTGARRVDLASAVTIVTTTLSTVGAVAVLALVEPTLRAFFLWQALVSALHSLAMRFAAQRVIGLRAGHAFDWPAIRSIWRFSAGMAAVTATGVVFSQIDKVVLMRTVSLDAFGYYTIAVALAGILYRLITPAFNVVYPQLCALFEAGSRSELAAGYHATTRTFLTVIFPVAMGIVVSANPILSLWLKDRTIVENTSLLTVLLTIGTAIHCTMYFPYALQIASGSTRIPLYTNVALSVIFLPAVFLLSFHFGAVGAATAWIILHALYFLLGSIVTTRYVLPGEGWTWVWRGVAPPLAISTIFGFAAALVMPLVGSDIAELVVGGIFVLCALVTGALGLPEGRLLARRTLLAMVQR